MTGDAVERRPPAREEFRGERILRAAERAVEAPNRLLERFLPEEANPLRETGAVANTLFIIAVVTGILLLFWYTPSVHGAWESLEEMKGSPFTAQLMRSLHRYSSDACVLFVFLHSLQIIASRRFGGPRWLAWVTGLLLAAILWILGWTGYWLVWDDRGALVMQATGKLLDALPLFAEPLSRTFLVDEKIASLQFFIVFFLHMTIPLGSAVALWLHVSRLTRARWLASRSMTAALFVSLVAVAILFPAHSSERASFSRIPERLEIDWFYLAPLLLIERIETGTLWLATFLLGAVALFAPWWMVRRIPEKARVLPEECTACRKCFKDCPYAAITMRPREGPFPLVAEIDPARCVSCGLCVSACPSGSIALPAGKAEAPRAVARAGGRLGQIAAAGALFSTLAGATVLLSENRYPVPEMNGGELVITFSIPGKEASAVSTAPDENLLPHMKPPPGAARGRERSPVSMSIRLDGRPLLERSYPPRGFFKDLSSVALERFPVPAGGHEVSITVEGSDGSPWSDTRVLLFEHAGRRVVEVEKSGEFEWR